MEYLVGGNGAVDFEPNQDVQPCNDMDVCSFLCRCLTYQPCTVLTCGDGGWFPCQCVHGG